MKKLFNILSVTLCMGIIMASCGSSETESDAQKLLNQAQTALEAKNTSLATALLDSIDKAYTSETKVRKSALKMRSQIVECETMKEIVSTDSLLSYYADLHKQMMNKMKLINDPQLVEPYYVAKSAFKADFVNTTGLQARVDEIGQFYMVSSVRGSSLKHSSVTISVDGANATTATIPYDGEANYRVGGSELVTYMNAQCDTLGKFAVAHRSQMGKLTFNGERKQTIQLSPAQIAAIADAWDFSQSIVQSRELTVQREKLDKKLQIARDQIARQTEE